MRFTMDGVTAAMLISLYYLLCFCHKIDFPRELGITQASVWIQPLRRPEMTEHLRRDDANPSDMYTTTNV